MDSVIRLDAHRIFTISKDPTWKSVTAASLSADCCQFRAPHDPKQIGPDLEETFVDKDESEITNLMLRVNGMAPLRDDLLWKDQRMQELLKKCRLNVNQAPTQKLNNKCFSPINRLN